MLIRIVFATSSPDRSKFVNVQKTRLLPDAFNARSYPHKFSIGGIHYGEGDFVSRVATMARESEQCYDAIIALWEADPRARIDIFSSAFFNKTIKFSDRESESLNFFRSTLAKTIKEFVMFSRLFEDAKYMKCFLLPLSVFVANEMRDLEDLLGLGNREGIFGHNLNSTVEKIRRRQFPKPFSRYATTYLRDDADRWFEWGHEEHARVETTIPPHDLICRVNSRFRFGRRYDENRHFNVTVRGERDKISGSIVNCHREMTAVSSRSHLNVFPNGYF
jgi:hypothetical protein